MQAGSAHYAATRAPDPEQRLNEAVAALQAIHTNAGQALVDLRGLLRVLRDPTSQESIVDPEQMITDAVQRSRTAGLDVSVTVDGDGARSTRISAPGTTPVAAADEGPNAAGVSVRGTASELVLFVYDRIPADSLQIEGDAGLFDLLRAWEPEE